MAVLKVKTDIIASIAASLIGPAVKLVIMYVETFKPYVIDFNCIKRHTDRYFPISVSLLILTIALRDLEIKKKFPL